MRGRFVTRASHDEATRQDYIQSYRFPRALRDKVAEEYDPALSESQVNTVLEGLRAWFVACLLGARKTLGMPSQAVDVAWHEFILFTRAYHDFCESAFGHYLHHDPEATMEEPLTRALRRTVKVADRHQAHLAVASIPFLFAIDSTLGLDEGNLWSPADLELLRSRGAVAGDAATGLYFGGGDDGSGFGGGSGCGGGGGGCGGGGGGG